jgi:hydroxypyruvate reductase
MTVRPLLESIHAAAVAGAQPGPATRAAVARLPLESGEPPRVLALGKAAHAMATAAVQALAGRGMEPAGGIVVAPETGPAPHPALGVHAGDHPVPGPRSRAAAEAVARAAATPGGDAIVLLSGGASSLVGAPLPGAGITPDDLAELTAALLGAGVDIGTLNAVRKRVSRWGAGRLAVALAPAAVHCLAVSDVIDDDLASIGSGPCVPDVHTAAVLAVRLRGSGVWGRLPPAVARFLADPARGETPKSDHPAFRRTRAEVILGNVHAREAAGAHARTLGCGAVIVHHQPLLGEASACGARLAELLVERAAAGARGECHVWGGEPTVTLAGASPDALGGRMQELVLSAAAVLHRAGPAAAHVALLAAGTDGRDGPTDAAGAHADAGTWARIAAAGRDPAADLAAHRSHAALDTTGSLLRTGLTGTNVADVVIGLVAG